MNTNIEEPSSCVRIRNSLAIVQTNRRHGNRRWQIFRSMIAGALIAQQCYDQRFYESARILPDREETLKLWNWCSLLQSLSMYTLVFCLVFYVIIKQMWIKKMIWSYTNRLCLIIAKKKCLQSYTRKKWIILHNCIYQNRRSTIDRE